MRALQIATQGLLGTGGVAGGGLMRTRNRRRTTKAYDDWLEDLRPVPDNLDEDFFPPEISAEVEPMRYEPKLPRMESMPVYEKADNLDREFNSMIDIVRFETAKAMLESKVLRDELRLFEEDEEIIEILLVTGMI